MLRRMVLILVGLLVLIALEARSADLFNKKWSVNTHAVSFLQISKDGTKILSNDGTQTIIYDLQTGDTLKIFEGKGQFSEDGLYILIPKEVKDSLDKNIYCVDVFDYNQFELIKTMKFPDLRFSYYNLFSSPKGDHLLFSVGAILTFIDFETGKVVKDTAAYDIKEIYAFPATYSVKWIHYSNDGNKLFVDRIRISQKMGSDAQIISFNTTAFERKYEIYGFTYGISLVGENDVLCYADSEDKETACKIYDTKNKIVLKKIYGVASETQHLNLSQDLKYLAFMKAGENLKILDFPNLQPIQDFVMTDNEFLSVFSKNGKYFAIGNNKTIDLYEIGTIGVEDKNNNLEIIYPNPTNSQFTIKFDLKKDDFLSFELFDMAGKLINILKNDYYKAGIQTETMDLNGINTGQYIIKINSVILNKSYKLVVTN